MNNESLGSSSSQPADEVAGNGMDPQRLVERIVRDDSRFEKILADYAAGTGDMSKILKELMRNNFRYSVPLQDIAPPFSSYDVYNALKKIPLSKEELEDEKAALEKGNSVEDVENVENADQQMEHAIVPTLDSPVYNLDSTLKKTPVNKTTSSTTITFNSMKSEELLLESTTAPVLQKTNSSISFEKPPNPISFRTDRLMETAFPVLSVPQPVLPSMGLFESVNLPTPLDSSEKKPVNILELGNSTNTLSEEPVLTNQKLDKEQVLNNTIAAAADVIEQLSKPVLEKKVDGPSQSTATLTSSAIELDIPAEVEVKETSTEIVADEPAKEESTISQEITHDKQEVVVNAEIEQSESQETTKDAPPQIDIELTTVSPIKLSILTNDIIEPVREIAPEVSEDEPAVPKLLSYDTKESTSSLFESKADVEDVEQEVKVSQAPVVVPSVEPSQDVPASVPTSIPAKNLSVLSNVSSSTLAVKTGSLSRSPSIKHHEGYGGSIRPSLYSTQNLPTHPGQHKATLMRKSSYSSIFSVSGNGASGLSLTADIDANEAPAAGYVETEVIRLFKDELEDNSICVTANLQVSIGPCVIATSARHNGKGIEVKLYLWTKYGSVFKTHESDASIGNLIFETAREFLLSPNIRDKLMDEKIISDCDNVKVYKSDIEKIAISLVNSQQEVKGKYSKREILSCLFEVPFYETLNKSVLDVYNFSVLDKAKYGELFGKSLADFTAQSQSDTGLLYELGIKRPEYNEEVFERDCEDTLLSLKKPKKPLEPEDIYRTFVKDMYNKEHTLISTMKELQTYHDELISRVDPSESQYVAARLPDVQKFLMIQTPYSKRCEEISNMDCTWRERAVLLLNYMLDGIKSPLGLNTAYREYVTSHRALLKYNYEGTYKQLFAKIKFEKSLTLDYSSCRMKPIQNAIYFDFIIMNLMKDCSVDDENYQLIVETWKYARRMAKKIDSATWKHSHYEDLAKMGDLLNGGGNIHQGASSYIADIYVQDSVKHARLCLILLDNKIVVCEGVNVSEMDESSKSKTLLKYTDDSRPVEWKYKTHAFLKNLELVQMNDNKVALHYTKPRDPREKIEFDMSCQAILSTENSSDLDLFIRLFNMYKVRNITFVPADIYTQRVENTDIIYRIIKNPTGSKPNYVGPQCILFASDNCTKDKLLSVVGSWYEVVHMIYSPMLSEGRADISLVNTVAIQDYSSAGILDRFPNYVGRKDIGTLLSKDFHLDNSVYDTEIRSTTLSEVKRKYDSLKPIFKSKIDDIKSQIEILQKKIKSVEDLELGEYNERKRVYLEAVAAKEEAEREAVAAAAAEAAGAAAEAEAARIASEQPNDDGNSSSSEEESSDEESIDEGLSPEDQDDLAMFNEDNNTNNQGSGSSNAGSSSMVGDTVLDTASIVGTGLQLGPRAGNLGLAMLVPSISLHTIMMNSRSVSPDKNSLASRYSASVATSPARMLDLGRASSNGSMFGGSSTNLISSSMFARLGDSQVTMNNQSSSSLLSERIEEKDEVEVEVEIETPDQVIKVEDELPEEIVEPELQEVGDYVKSNELVQLEQELAPLVEELEETYRAFSSQKEDLLEKIFRDGTHIMCRDTKTMTGVLSQSIRSIHIRNNLADFNNSYNMIISTGILTGATAYLLKDKSKISRTNSNVMHIDSHVYQESFASTVKSKFNKMASKMFRRGSVASTINGRTLGKNLRQ